MAEILEIPQADGSKKTVTKAEFLSFKLFQLAATGDLPAIKLCLDHVDGAPKQHVEHSGSIQRPMPLSPDQAREAAERAAKMATGEV